MTVEITGAGPTMAADGAPLKMKSGNTKSKILEENRACHIVITCGKPSEDGDMAVEMSYEGDPTLAAYLLESAQGFIDESDEGITN